MKKIAFAISMLAVLALTQNAAAEVGSTSVINRAAHYNFTTIDFPGASFTEVTGINSYGEMTGFYRLPGSGQYHGFWRSADGEFTNIDVTGALGTGATGINDLRQIVGFYIDSSRHRHGFLYEGGAFTNIDVDGALMSEAAAINDSGTIVGFFLGADLIYHGFSLAAGKFHTIDVPGAFDTIALDVNDWGAVAGNWDTDPNTTGHGFVFWSGHFIKFDDPDAAPASTTASGINALGQVVGGYADNAGNAHGFVATGATFKTLDYPGSLATFAQKINAAGLVVGWYFSTTGGHGFVATPANQHD